MVDVRALVDSHLELLGVDRSALHPSAPPPGPVLGREEVSRLVRDVLWGLIGMEVSTP